jgi:hemin uptake protein HemP
MPPDARGVFFWAGDETKSQHEVGVQSFRLISDSGIKWMVKAMLSENEELNENALREIGERSISSKWLFGEAKVVKIEHGNFVYRLMITRQGKLILNK